MKIVLIFFMIGFSVSTLVVSCKNDAQKAQGKKVKQAKKIILPDNLVVYNPFDKPSPDHVETERGSLRIYSFVDASCPSCITNIKNWDKISTEFSRLDVQVILIFQSNDNFELFKYLCESKDIPEFKFPFFFDVKDNFFLLNPTLNPAPNNHTVLTDPNNNILEWGDPTLSLLNEQSYFVAIKSYRAEINKTIQIKNK